MPELQRSVSLTTAAMTALSVIKSERGMAEAGAVADRPLMAPDAALLPLVEDSSAPVVVVCVAGF